MSLNVELSFERCLLPFDARQIPVYRFDVVVLGSGVAGASAAITMARRGLSVAVITKAELSEGNTRYAQGGLAAVHSATDSLKAHIDDTLQVACGLAEPDVVAVVVQDASAAVRDLIAWGARFDRTEDGSLALSREGGHSHARVVHAQGDSTGLEIQRALEQALQSNRGITTFSECFAIDLLCDDDHRVAGVLCQKTTGERVAFGAGEVVLATGGSGQIFRETTNPPVATADGIGMAFRAGAHLRDLEFVQFHPTCLYIAGAARVLISEIVRGAGGILRDRHGVRFMPEYHPAAELAPRDVVSRAVFKRMVETEDTNVYLDLSQIEGDPHRAFPGISRVCRAFGIDIAREPIPVRPGAHYHVGGVQTDLDGRTSLPGLWAIGECASSGLHGANRMGSNSLLEGLVLGRRTGDTVSPASRPSSRLSSFGDSKRQAAAHASAGVSVNIEDLTYSLKSMMWRHMGVQRDGAGMREAEVKLGFWSRVVRDLAAPGLRTFELLNMLTVARLATISALQRRESRGVHFREDFPQPSESERTHTILVPILEGERPSRVRVDREPVLESLPTPS